MPRAARFVVPGYPFHITHRGNNKEEIFQNDEDRRKYIIMCISLLLLMANCLLLGQLIQHICGILNILITSMER